MNSLSLVSVAFQRPETKNEPFQIIDRNLTADIRVDEFDGIPLLDSDLGVFLGKDEPPVMLDDQISIIFLEMMDQRKKGRKSGDGFLMAVDDDFHSVIHIVSDLSSEYLFQISAQNQIWGSLYICHILSNLLFWAIKGCFSNADISDGI